MHMDFFLITFVNFSGQSLGLRGLHVVLKVVIKGQEIELVIVVQVQDLLLGQRPANQRRAQGVFQHY